jgi:hypothetical protein
MATYDKFFITKKGYKDYLQVRVYKTQKAMINASKKLDALYKYKEIPDAKDKGAFFYCTPVHKCKECESELTAEMYGIMLLNEECLTYDLIAHECFHAMLAHERLINRYMLDYYNEYGEEERAAFHFQYIFANILSALKEYGYKVRQTTKSDCTNAREGT